MTATELRQAVIHDLEREIMRRRVHLRLLKSRVPVADWMRDKTIAEEQVHLYKLLAQRDELDS